MAYSQKCKLQIRSRSGRIIKNKKCFCCKQSKLITKAPARKRRNVKKNERPTLSELENLAKMSIKQTQQHKRKLDESSTSDIRKTLNKKSHLTEENEREEQSATLQNISEEKCIKDSTNKNDSKITQENQISNNPSEFVELVLNLNENGIGTHLNQELSINPENQIKPQNESEKKVTEGLDNKTINENQIKIQNTLEKKEREDLDNKTINENKMETQYTSEKKEKEDLDKKTTNENKMQTQNTSEKKEKEDLDNKITNENPKIAQNTSENNEKEDLDNKTTNENKMETQNTSEKKEKEDLDNKITNENPKIAQNTSENKEKEYLDNKTTNENKMETQNTSEKKEKEDLDNKTTNENKMETQNTSEKKEKEELDNKITNENPKIAQNTSENKEKEDLDNKTTNENKMETQNTSEKKEKEDIDKKITNENQILSERYYLHDFLDFLKKKKIQRESYKKMSKCQENIITVEKLKANLPRRSLMRDFFDSLNKGQTRYFEESENLGDGKTEKTQMGQKIESEKKMPRLSLKNDLLNFFKTEQISKLQDNITLGQHKIDEMKENSEKTPADTPKMKNKQSDDENKNQDNNSMEQSNLETLHKIRGLNNSKQIGTKIQMMTDLISTLQEKQNNLSKMIELYVDVSQDQENDATLKEEKNKELLLKTLESTEKETNSDDFLQELLLEDEINANVSLRELLPQQTNNDFLLREYLSEESNFSPPLLQSQVEGPSTEVEENEEIENLEKVTVYLTIQETDIESNELQFQEQNNDQNENTSEQHLNQNNEQNNISSEQNQNLNDDQGESDSQSSEQSHNQENDIEKKCIHITRIRVFYIKNGIVEHAPIKKEMKETGPKPGCSGMKTEKKEAKEDVKNEEFTHTNTSSYPNQPCNFVFQTGRTEKTPENEKQHAFIKDLRDGRITMIFNENETFDEDEGIICIICGKRNLQTRYIFIDSNEVDYGSLSSEEILERYWYDEE